MSNQSPAPSPRLRRLYADQVAMYELAQVSDLITYAAGGHPADRYRVWYRCRGLYLPEGAPEPEVMDQHEAEFYLHRDYPRRPPQIMWRTEIFHPNILSASRGGAICIGRWTPSESLADLVVRVGEMIQYRQYNADDELDHEAAMWAEAHADLLPVDDRLLAVYLV